MGEKGIFGCKKQVINSRELGIGQTKRSAEIYSRTSGIRTRCSSRISRMSVIRANAPQHVLQGLAVVFDYESPVSMAAEDPAQYGDKKEELR